MSDILWIWWMFELLLLFLSDMAYYILGLIVLWWVAKNILSQRHRNKSLTTHRLRDAFRQSFDE
jgi:hypothetical protein